MKVNYLSIIVKHVVGQNVECFFFNDLFFGPERVWIKSQTFYCQLISMSMIEKC